MKKIILAGVLGLFLAVVSSFAIDPADLNSVVILNNTGYEIQYLFLSPGDSDYWGPDILGSTRTLGNHGALGFYVHYPDECNNFDIMAVDEDGDSYIIWDFTICDDEQPSIVITGNELAKDTPDFSFVSLEIMNSTDYDMYYVFISPTDSGMWGIDLLDEETILETGMSAEFLIPIEGDVGEYDFLSLDVDDDLYQFSLTIDPYEGEELFVEIEPSDYVDS